MGTAYMQWKRFVVSKVTDETTIKSRDLQKLQCTENTVSDIRTGPQHIYM